MVALAGCQSTGSTSGSIETGSITRPDTIDPAYGRSFGDENADPLAEYARAAAEVAIEDGQIYGATAHLARVFRSEPHDAEIAYELGRHLRYLGASTEAEQVLTEALIYNPGHALLRLEQGKARIAGGRAREALDILEPLRAEHPRDPAVLQALGVAFDRLGRHDDAKDVYRAAIDRGRPSAALLNNYALSYLLDGNLDEAVRILRTASVAPGASAQVRLNLAMALALSGEGAEAREIAYSVAPEEAAGEMIAFFEQMVEDGLAPADAWSAAAQ